MSTEGCGVNHHSWARIPIFPLTYAPIAQLKEQFRPKEKVEGLSPSGSTAVWCNGLASVSLKQGVLVRIQLPPQICPSGVMEFNIGPF